MKKITKTCLLLLSIPCLAACTTPHQTTTINTAKISDQSQAKVVAPLIQVVKSPERLRIILYSDVCFLANGDLTQPCAQQLASTIKTIKRYGDGLIQVVGYSDDLFDENEAEKITQRQANSVVAYLWSEGRINARRLRAVGYGNHDTIASNRNVRSSAQNRRVEIMLVK